jgi:tetratricopeptide (TPR) repeat protein
VLVCVVAVLATVQLARADVDALGRALETEDLRALAEAVSAIERAPVTPELADVLFAAGRACEDRLLDPARALAIYERILRELPDAGVSIAAGRRAEKMRGFAAHAREAAELAQLVANADQIPRDEVQRRAEALVAAPWPGAVVASVFLADWLCRTGRYGDAQMRYTNIRARWPDTDQARLARRNAAGCAIEAKHWVLAEQLAEELPTADEIDRAIREDLIESAARGRFRERLYTASWIALVLVIAALLASLAEAILRGGLHRPTLRPPIEVMFLAPVAAVIVFASFTAHRAIAPAVTRISLVGLALAWMSGIALDLLRTRDRTIRLRAVVHVAACMIGVLAIGYIAMTRDNLLDMLAETVKFGPD